MKNSLLLNELKEMPKELLDHDTFFLVHFANEDKFSFVDYKTGKSYRQFTPKILGNYIDVLCKCAEQEEAYGIHFYITKDDPFAVMTLKKADGSFAPQEWADDIIEECKCYTTDSVITNNIHILFRCGVCIRLYSDRIDVKSHDVFIPMYQGNRYSFEYQEIRKIPINLIDYFLGKEDRL